MSVKNVILLVCVKDIVFTVHTHNIIKSKS